MAKKNFGKKKKTAGAIAHTVGLTEEQYVEKLKELGLDYKDSVFYSCDVVYTVDTLDQAVMFCKTVMDERYSVYGDLWEYYYVIPKEKGILTGAYLNPDCQLILPGFYPPVDDVGQHRFLALIEGENGMFSTYPCRKYHPEGSTSSAA